MSALVDKKQKPNFRKAFRPTSAFAETVEFKDEVMEVPLIWFPVLYEASAEQRQRCEIGGGTSLHWEEIKEGSLGLSGVALPQSAQRPLRKGS